MAEEKEIKAAKPATAKKTPAAKAPAKAAAKPAAEKKAPAAKAPAKPAAKAPAKPAAEIKAPAAKAEPKTAAKPAPKKAVGTVKIKLIRSFTGRLNNQIATAKSLGLKKIGDTTVQPDNEATIGKLAKISHMVVVTNA